MKKFILGIIIIFFSYAFISHPAQISESVYNSISLCTAILIPSLFPFMFLSLFIVKSGFAQWLAKICSPVIRHVFHLPANAAAAVITSLLGGYPSGAQAVCELYKDGMISKKRAERLMRFCVCAGPAFLISAVGTVYFENPKAGLILLVSQIISSLLIGIIMGFIERNDDIDSEPVRSVTPSGGISESFVYSTRGAASGLLSVCSFVMLFSVIICILDEFKITEAVSSLLVLAGFSEELAQALLPNLLEITGALSLSVSVGLPYVAFITAFGGICIHFQIFNFTKEIGISKINFMIFRILHGILCSIITILIMSLSSGSVAAFASSTVNHSPSASSPAGGAALIILCAATVLLIPGKNKRNNFKNPFKHYHR